MSWSFVNALIKFIYIDLVKHISSIAFYDFVHLPIEKVTVGELYFLYTTNGHYDHWERNRIYPFFGTPPFANTF